MNSTTSVVVCQTSKGTCVPCTPSFSEPSGRKTIELSYPSERYFAHLAEQLQLIEGPPDQHCETRQRLRLASEKGGYLLMEHHGTWTLGILLRAERRLGGVGRFGRGGLVPAAEDEGA